MTRPNGRALVDFAVAVQHADEHGLRVALGYLIGASAHSVAVRRALNGAIDAIATDRQIRRELARACPTCSGSSRETVGLVCQTCGWNYGDGEP